MTEQELNKYRERVGIFSTEFLCYCIATKQNPNEVSFNKKYDDFLPWLKEKRDEFDKKFNFEKWLVASTKL